MGLFIPGILPCLPNPWDDAARPGRETAKKEGRALSHRRHNLTTDHIQPRRPGGAGWARTENPAAAGETWANAAAGLLAVSDVVPGPPPAFRLTLTQVDGGRCTAAEVLLALFDFELLDAQEEDFAHSGAARVFSCPVATT